MNARNAGGFWRGAAALAAVFAAVLLAGCERKAAPAGATAVLNIGTDAIFPPFHLKDEHGHVTGYEVELAKRVARAAGFDPQIKVMPFNQLLAGLDDGTIDMVAATHGITPERQEKYLFSLPHFDTCQAVVVRKGDGQPATLADLAGKRVGASGDGTSARAARNLPGVEYVRIEAGKDAVEELLAGNIDAFVIDEFEAVDFQQRKPDALAIIPEPAAPEQYAFVMKLGRDDLKRKIDAALAGIVNSAAGAELQDRHGAVRRPGWPVHVTPPVDPPPDDDGD